MKKRFKLGLSMLSILACFGLVLAQFPLMSSAVIAGTDPIIDPSINTDKTLPEGYDQGLKDGLPYGYFVVDDSATYSFGTAMDSKGNLYTSSYSKGTISVRYKDAFGYISLLSEEETIKMETGAIFGLAMTSDDKLAYCVCYDEGGYVGLYDLAAGTTTKIIPDLVRPNDCFVDGSDNVYVACENGVIKKWEKATGEVTVVASGLGGLQSVAVDKTGVVYALTYSVATDVPLIGVAIRGGTLYQINTDGSVERVAGNNNQYVWRSRGLAIDEYGYVLLTGEGNAWDNGNSSLVARYDPRTRAIEPVSTGMDYLTFITYGEDGRIYGNLARDNKSIAYSEAAEDDFVLQFGWDSVGDSRIITYGGSYTKSSDANLTIQVGELAFSGAAMLNSGSNKLSGWVSVPADSLPEVSKEEKDGGLRGIYPVPDVIVTSAAGTAKATAMVLREHVRSRWPMIDLYTNAADFSEAPEAYLVYFEWTPENLDTYVDTAETHDIYRTTGVLPAAPAYNASAISALDFSGSAAATQLDEETGITAITLSATGNTAYTRYQGNDLEIAFRIDENVGDWLGISVDNRAASTLGEGVGLRTLLWANGNVTARMVNGYEGFGWESAAATQTLHDGPAVTALNSGWHTLRITNNFGEWDIYVDGTCISKNAYAGFDGDMTELVGGAATFLTFYSASGTGAFSVKVATDEDVPAKSKLTFGSRGEAWAYDLEADVYSTVGITNSHYITGNLEEGVEFEYKASGIQDWFFMNIGNADAVFPAGDDFFYDFCHGTGLKVMAKTDGAAEARLITKTESAGWESAPWKNTVGGIASKLVNDNVWHKVSISKASGKWSVKIDGRELLDNIDAANLETLNSKLDGEMGYIVIGSNAYAGALQVREIKATGDQPDTPVIPEGELTFASRGEAWAYDMETKVYSTVGITNTHYMTGNLEAGVEFEFLSSGIQDWFFMNIGNASAVFPEGDDFFYDFCHGTGLKLLIKTDGSAEARLITQTEAAGWNGAPWKNMKSGVAANFHDGTTWHKVSISKASGQWSIKVDGVDMLEGMDAANLATLNGLLDGETGYIVIGANGHTGNVSIRENAAGGDSGSVASGGLNFSSRGEAWTYDLETDVYSTVGITNSHYMTGNLEAGVEFEYKASGIQDWFFMNIGNAAAVFPEGDDFFYDFCHGTGLKVLAKTDGSAEARLITQTEAAGWNNAPWVNRVGGIATALVNDDVWHKVSISKTSGQWSIKVDGAEMLDGIDADNLATLNGLLDGETGYIVIGANGHTGNLQIRDLADADEGGASDGDLAKLDLKIQVAKNLYNNTTVGVNYGQVSQEAKDALAVAGKAAVAVAESKDPSASVITAAIDDLQGAIDTFKAAVVESCNFGDLATILQSAQNMFAKASVGTAPGQVPQANYDEMKAAIDKAIKVYRTQGVTQAMLDEMLAELTDVVSRFASAVVVDDTPIAFDWLAQNGATFENLDAETIHAVLPIAGSQVNTVVNPVNLTFKVCVDPSQNFEWFSLVFSNSGANRLAGDGVCAVFWLDYKADIRVVESVSGKGWDGEGKNKQLFTGTLAGDSFADAFKDFKDGEWAEFKLGRNADGSWYFTLDGKDLIVNEYEGIWSDFDRLLGGGNTVTMNLYTNGAYGEVDVYQDTTGAKVSFGALNTLIQQAETLLAETEENRAPASAFEALRAAIATAEAVKAKPDVTFAEASAAKDAMQAAINEFLAAVELTYDSIEFEKDIAAFGTEVNEDNLYDALIVIDAWEALTEAQQALVSDEAVADLATVRRQVYALLRSENGVTIGGETLPYYVHILLDNYQAENGIAFDLAAEDWLTFEAYELGSDGEYIVTVDLPDSAKDGDRYKVTMTYDNGTTATAVVAVKGARVSFKAVAGGSFSLVETDEEITENTPPADDDNTSPDTGSASVLPIMVLLLAALAVVLATRRTAKAK
ncbi:MAG: FIVAR domain-containing protein [Clostridia bacterium]|nr:FIVAR domain-containing protein [Clostridia bacterium]